jgi:hypothetical protein
MQSGFSMTNVLSATAIVMFPFQVEILIEDSISDAGSIGHHFVAA